MTENAICVAYAVENVWNDRQSRHMSGVEGAEVTDNREETMQTTSK